jgi:hypothetical protein
VVVWWRWEVVAMNMAVRKRVTGVHQVEYTHDRDAHRDHAPESTGDTGERVRRSRHTEGPRRTLQARATIERAVGSSGTVDARCQQTAHTKGD